MRYKVPMCLSNLPAMAGCQTAILVRKEEDIYFHNLSRRQLLALASVTMRRPFDEESILSEGEEPVMTETAPMKRDSHGMLRRKGRGWERGRARRRSRGRGPRIGGERDGRASLDRGEVMANEDVESDDSSPSSLEQKNRRRARGRGRGTATQYQGNYGTTQKKILKKIRHKKKECER
ncbi:unnamed protein product [Parnassius apollo]|uniref:(apollo) hypothetical protein n=1 Tax=Parnassius apollo TaxID=110799 RepID=A0A8S3XK06_PARAO|nr:unnamed protein product [Parnassius apollo]